MSCNSFFPPKTTFFERPTHENPIRSKAIRNPELGLIPFPPRRNWLALGMVAVLGLSASAQAQWTVVNGDFSDLTGLTQGNDGWYTGLPTGWSGSGNAYAVNAKTGATPPTCNPSQLGFLRQNVGTLAKASEVVLTFDVSEPWAAGAVLNAAILDGNFVQLAGGDFSAGAKQTLVAKQVPAGTSIIIAFQAAKLTPGLDNVSDRGQGTGFTPRRLRHRRPSSPSRGSRWRVTISATTIRAIRGT